MYTMRFDMRAPVDGAPATELYATALEMCAWAETRGCLAATLSEHHMCADGYLPSPIILATAMAARTSSLPITLAIIQLPLYNPVRLAEDMAILDILSGGRVSYVGGLGYLPAEYEMHGVDFRRRGAIAEENLELLLKAKSGEPFVHEGRLICVTPRPLTPGGPTIAWGGGSVPAARRAGKYGLNFIAQNGNNELRAVYEDACKKNGHVSGMCILAPRDAATVMFVAEDVEAAWEELGPFLMNDVQGYAAWNEGDVSTSNVSFAKTATELRGENRSHRILTVEQAIETVQDGSLICLHPLIGGLPPSIAWRYLKNVTEKVGPALAQGAQ